MAPLSINTSSNSATNRTIKSISPLSISTTTSSNYQSMKQSIRLIGIAILCFGAGKLLCICSVVIVAMQCSGLYSISYAHQV